MGLDLRGMLMDLARLHSKGNHHKCRCIAPFPSPTPLFYRIVASIVSETLFWTYLTDQWWSLDWALKLPWSSYTRITRKESLENDLRGFGNVLGRRLKPKNPSQGSLLALSSGISLERRLWLLEISSGFFLFLQSSPSFFFLGKKLLTPKSSLFPFL
ncbi:hypothetical protein VNO77_20178 [Canavalia gladiata]|uniref:Uncharacterized protein n=1 Tax=Canavalia gladiata TaxID=3824 RepID=A0AAN9LNZ7_CANGL